MNKEDIDKQLEKILLEIRQGLVLLGVKLPKHNSKAITQIKYLTEILYKEYYSLKAFEKLKSECISSGYKEFPFKRIDREYWLLYSKNYEPKILEHRFLMNRKLGKKLDRTEIVHHLDGNKLNNSLDNLFLTNNKDHVAIHKLQRELNDRPEWRLDQTLEKD